MTDEEWGYVEPLIPPAKRGGRKREVDVREVLNGIMYVLSTGCQWAYLPKDLPPSSTVYYYFDLFTYNGTLEKIHHAHAIPAYAPAYYEIRQCLERARDNPYYRKRGCPVVLSVALDTEVELRPIPGFQPLQSFLASVH
jgi:transposase